jgi:hypothetical protein
MRLLTTGGLLVLLTAPALAADKNEEKARDVTREFLKAMKAKDADAVMKTVGVPFTFGGTDKALKTEEEVKSEWFDFLRTVEPDRLPDAVGKALDIPTVRKALAAMKEKDRSPRDVAILKHAEGVKGDAVYLVQLLKDGQGRGGVIVRVKDGKAAVVWIHK